MLERVRGSAHEQVPTPCVARAKALRMDRVGDHQSVRIQAASAQIAFTLSQNIAAPQQCNHATACSHLRVAGACAHTAILSIPRPPQTLFAITCPHCLNVEADDLEVLDDDEAHELTCCHCGSSFFLRITTCPQCGHEELDSSEQTMRSEPSICTRCGAALNGLDLDDELY